MRLGSHEITRNSKPFVIAEIAQAHEGSLGNALALIDVAKDVGANAVKFQTHIASEESTIREPWRVKFSQQDATRYAYWERMEFSKDEWRILAEYCQEKGLVFLSSPFSPLAIEWLEELDVAAWKVASGEVFNQELIDLLVQTQRPIIVSSGMSSIDNSIDLVRYLEERGADVSVLHCTTSYPVPPESAGLNAMTALMEELECPVGLSDHSGDIFAPVVAAYLGATIFEVHITFSKRMFGPDIASSLSPRNFKKMVRGVAFAHQMRMSPVDKKEQVEQLGREKTIFGRSLVAAKYLTAGATLCEEDIAYKKPGGGLSFADRESLIGKRLNRDVEADEELLLSMLVGPEANINAD